MISGERLSVLREGDTAITPGGQLPESPPPWLDKEKFSRARKIYSKYFASINFSHLCGLLLSFYFSKNIKTLNSTGSSDSTAAIFRRYLTTVRYVQSWYEGDIWNPEDSSRKSLSLVRSMHSNVAAKMAQRKDGVTYVSQWDMAVTQWGFIGPIILFPSKVGIHGCSEEDLDALVHFWRGIGYLLGVDEKFNLCSGSLNDVKKACRSMLAEEYKVKLSEANPSSVSMCVAVMEAFRKIDPLLRWGSMATFIHRMVNVPCPVNMTFLDWMCYWLTHCIIVYSVRINIFRILLNIHFRWKLNKADREIVLKREHDKTFITHASSG